jgi:hypothetical protein
MSHSQLLRGLPVGGQQVRRREQRIGAPLHELRGVRIGARQHNLHTGLENSDQQTIAGGSQNGVPTLTPATRRMSPRPLHRLGRCSSPLAQPARALFHPKSVLSRCQGRPLRALRVDRISAAPARSSRGPFGGSRSAVQCRARIAEPAQQRFRRPAGRRRNPTLRRGSSRPDHRSVDLCGCVWVMGRRQVALCAQPDPLLDRPVWWLVWVVG